MTAKDDKLSPESIASEFIQAYKLESFGEGFVKTIVAELATLVTAERQRLDLAVEALKKYSNADLKGDKFFVRLPCEDRWCHISKWARECLEKLGVI